MDASASGHIYKNTPSSKAQGTLRTRIQKYCKSQRPRVFAVRLYYIQQLIKKAAMYVKENKEIMGGVEGKRGREE